MKKKFNLSLLIIVLAIILSFSLITGCGDDGSVSVTTPAGPTGPQGEIGATGPTGDTNWASITLEVGLSDGSSFSNYVATLINKSSSTESSEDAGASAVPDENGVYVFEYVAPGDYRLIIEAEGYCPQTREFTLAPGENKVFSGDDEVTMVRGLYGATFYNVVPYYGKNEIVDTSQIPISGSSVYLINCNSGESTLINTIDYTIIAMDFLPGSNPEAIYAVAFNSSLQEASFNEDITASGPVPYYFDPNSLVLLQMDSGANVTNVTDLRYTGGVPISTSDSISDVSFDSSGQFYIFLERDWFDPNDPNEPDCIVPVDISTGIISDPNTAVSAPGNDTQYNSMAFTSGNFFYIRGEESASPIFISTLYSSPVGLSPFSTINSSIEYLFFGMDYRDADSNMFASAYAFNESNPYYYYYSNAILVSIDLQTGDINPKGPFKDVGTQNSISIYSIASPLTQQLP